MGNQVDLATKEIDSKEMLNTDLSDVIELLVIGFIRENIKNNQIPNKDIQHLMLKFYRKKDLVIGKDKVVTLHSHSRHYAFDSITIKEKGKLTVNEWNSSSQSGGILNIICNGDIKLENKAEITVTGKGYRGGNGSNMSGESYKTASKKGISSNLGGGGGANGISAGGGGYGTNGIKGNSLHDPVNKHQANVVVEMQNPAITTLTSVGASIINKKCGNGGKKYGDKSLSILHLGSGGGSIMNNNGGCGGGAIKIRCFGNIILNGKSKICANGINGLGNKSGCGSGGSIFIIIKKSNNLQLTKHKSEIRSIGAKNYTPGCAGDGGDGRIRISCIEEKRPNFKQYLEFIQPKPYIK